MPAHTRETCGLSIETRVRLVTELQKRVLEQPKLPDGRKAMLVTPADFRVFQSLALDFYNGATGRCDPGYRAIQRKANVALGTITNSTRRLREAGWLSWVLRLRYVHGTLRFCRVYVLPPEVPQPRSRAATKPIQEVRKGLVDKSKAQPPARSVEAQKRLWEAQYGPIGPLPTLRPPVRHPAVTARGHSGGAGG